MYIEKSYKVKYLKDEKEVWAWLSPSANPDDFNPIEKILVIVLKAENGYILTKNEEEEIGESVFLNNEEDKNQYSEKLKPEKDEDKPKEI